MHNKKSFILYKDSLSILDDLTDDQAGKLFKTISSFQLEKKHECEGIIKIAFNPFKNQFIRDNAEYSKKCEKNKINGRKGGRPKKTQPNPKNPSGYLKTQPNPKNPDKDTDKDTDKYKKESSSKINTLEKLLKWDWRNDEKFTKWRKDKEFLPSKVKRNIESLELYCKRTGKKYKDYVSALKTFMRTDNEA